VGFNPLTDINFNLSGVTIINFLCDGNLMFGDPYKTDIILNSIVTLVAGIQINNFNGDNLVLL
jgi:hypothetical protein